MLGPGRIGLAAEQPQHEALRAVVLERGALEPLRTVDHTALSAGIEVAFVLRIGDRQPQALDTAVAPPAIQEGITDGMAGFDKQLAAWLAATGAELPGRATRRQEVGADAPAIGLTIIVMDFD